MKRKRLIIHIDEEKCDGCGDCIVACSEGALALVDGKARLVGEAYCDGLGDCIGECHTGALTIVEREAEEFDENAVRERLAASAAPSFSCPGAALRDLSPEPAGDSVPVSRPASVLTHWPVKLRLLGPWAPFLRGSHLMLIADCVGMAHPALHTDLFPGRTVACACPKFDDLQAHIDKLSDIIGEAEISALDVVHMEVPCCSSLVYAAVAAASRSGRELPVRRIQVGVDGAVQHEEDIPAAGGCGGSCAGGCC